MGGFWLNRVHGLAGEAFGKRLHHQVSRVFLEPFAVGEEVCLNRLHPLRQRYRWQAEGLTVQGVTDALDVAVTAWPVELVEGLRAVCQHALVALALVFQAFAGFDGHGVGQHPLSCKNKQAQRRQAVGR